MKKIKFARWISKSGCRWSIDIKHGKPESNQCSNCEHVYDGPQKDECPNCGCKMIKHGTFNSGRYPYSQEDMVKIFLRQQEGERKS